MPLTLPVTPYTPFGGAILSSVVEAVVKRAVNGTLDREDVHVETDTDVVKATEKVTDAVITAVNNHPAVAVVPTQSPLVDGVNWTVIIGFVLTLLTAVGVPLDDHTKLVIVEGLGAVGGLVAIVIKTYYTKTIATTAKPTPTT